MQLNFFTWNVKNNKEQSFYTHLHQQLIEDKIDILVLQECYIDTAAKLLANYEEIPDFEYEKGKRWVRIFLNKASNLQYSFQASYINNKMKGVAIETPSNFKFNLFGIHLYSETGSGSREQQLFDNQKFYPFIREFESVQKNMHTLVVGDFNYNPFDTAFLHPNLFITSNSRQIINLFQQNNLGNKHFFYNPMWNLLGDYDYMNKVEKVTGTYYWEAKDITKFYWNLIDGVIVRPMLMNNLLLDTLQIVTILNNQALVKTTISKPTETLLVDGYSDHLPIRFSLNVT